MDASGDPECTLELGPWNMVGRNSPSPFFTNMFYDGGLIDEDIITQISGSGVGWVWGRDCTTTSPCTMEASVFALI